MNFHFTEQAESDFFELASMYSDIREVLGEEFADAVFGAIDRILDYPQFGTRLSPNTRKANLGKFPYHLIYQVRDADIRILALWHNKRKPGSWKKRNKHS